MLSTPLRTASFRPSARAPVPTWRSCRFMGGSKASTVTISTVTIAFSPMSNASSRLWWRLESISSCSRGLQLCCNTIAALRFGRSAIAIFSFNGATKSAPKRCWSLAGSHYRYDAEHKLRDRHSHDFVDAAENNFDLHWYSLLECCEEGIDDNLWSRSYHIEWKGLRLRVLAPEDELLVAGMGGIREPMNARLDWIYDASLILKATPDFDWRLLHEELKRRKFQLSFMSAIGLLHRFVPHFPHVAVEKEFFHEIRSAVERLVAENRTFGLDPETDRQLTAALSFPAGFRHFVGAILGGDKRKRIARSGNVTRYMRYCSHEDGSISHLYFHRDVRTFLDDIFDVVDSTALRRAKNYARRCENVHLCLPSGVLRIPPKVRPQQYAARVNVDNQMLQFTTPDITSLSVVVRITNDASRPWHVWACDDCQFGLSYHLAAEDGELISWDLPRRYFLVPLRNQVALLLPGDSLQVELEILRPQAPGRYEARLDIVHELIAWFDPSGQHFPRLPIEVL